MLYEFASNGHVFFYTVLKTNWGFIVYDLFYDKQKLGSAFFQIDEESFEIESADGMQSYSGYEDVFAAFNHLIDIDMEKNPARYGVEMPMQSYSHWGLFGENS